MYSSSLYHLVLLIDFHPSASNRFLWYVYRVLPVRTRLMPIWINVLLDHLVLHWAIGNSSYPTSGSADLVLIFVASGRGILSVRQFLSYSTSCFWSSFSLEWATGFHMNHSVPWFNSPCPSVFLFGKRWVIGSVFALLWHLGSLDTTLSEYVVPMYC